MNPRTMMWANYRRGPSICVPSPYDGDPHIPWWYDKVANMAHGWAENGVTDVLFPNPLKTNAGAFPGADGYGPFDDYDIGSKTTMQFGGKATRFGIDEQLRRAIAVCHANGMNVLIDHVMHHRMGGRGGVYKYLGADGKTQNGRFPKIPSCFLGSPPRVPRDIVPAPQDDFAFGDQLCPINAKPPRYVADGLINAGNWLFDTLDVDGARLDDMKGMNIGFIKEFVSSGSMKGKWFFGEYASGNRNDTDWWVSQVDGLCSAADFDFHYNMAQVMCNNAGNNKFKMSWLAGRGMIGSWPMKAVPFVESMDSDTNGFATVIFNKILGYALMLCSEGMPTIYIRDYLEEPECYGLNRYINNLMWVHQNLANGRTIPRHGDDKIFIFERDGPPGLVVTLNNSVWDPAWKYVNIQTGFGKNVQLHDYTGHNANDCWTDDNGRVTLAIPPGANGLGYGCWSRAGLGKPNQTTSRSTTQTFFGASDLDIAQAQNGALIVGRIWVAKGSPVNVEFSSNIDNWTTDSSVQWEVIDSNNGQVANGIQLNMKTKSNSHGIAQIDGWHTLVVTGNQLPALGSDFKFKVTYTAPKTFKLPATSPTRFAQLAPSDPKLGEEIAKMSEELSKYRQAIRQM